MKIEITISSRLSFNLKELEDFSEVAFIGLQKLFTYKNPKFLTNEKFGYSNYGVPSHIYTYIILKGKMYINRGGQDKVIKHLKKFGVVIKWIDKTQDGDDVDFSQSNTVLRPEQKELVSDMLKHTHGIAIAYTSFGKSPTLLELVKHVGKRALILVHTTFLQEQWIEEMVNPKLFNISKDRIGGAGGVFSGKKFKVRDINIALYHTASKPEIVKAFNDAGVGLVIIDEGQKAAIDGFQDVVNNLKARYKYSATAQIKRKDGLEVVVMDAVGDIRHTAIEKNSASKIMANVRLSKTGFYSQAYDMGELGPTQLITEMALDRDRNIFIAKKAIARIKRGEFVLIFVERKVQVGILAKYLSKFRVDMLIGPANVKKLEEDENLIGRVPKGAFDILRAYDPKGAYERVKTLGGRRGLDVVIGTQKAYVGLSVRTFDYGIATTPIGNNLEKFKQIIGRLERTHSDEQEELYGKKQTPVLDILVDDVRTSENSSKSIESKYKDRIIK